MKEFKRSKLIEELDERLPQWKKNHIDHMMTISAILLKHIDEKYETRKEFADKMGKKESEISKWLSGTHNFTLKSIAKIEAELGEQIIFTKDEIKGKEQEALKTQ